MGWTEIAYVFLDEDLDAATLARESARLRKRFQITRARLLDLWRRRGLLPAKAG